MADAPEAVVLTEDGWWVKSRQDEGGWWWERVSSQPPGFIHRPRRYSQLPRVIETYQPSSVIHELARTAE